MFLYFDVLTESRILNLEFLLLISLLDSIYVFDSTSKGFILIVLWHLLSYLLTVSSNLSIQTFFETEVVYL